MGSLSTRLTGGVVYACLFFALAAGAIGTVGIDGVRTATDDGIRVASDELATSTATAKLGQAVAAAYSTGQALTRGGTPRQRLGLTAALYDEQLPAVDLELAAVQRLHVGDDAGEVADLARLDDQWSAVRAALNPATIGSRSIADPARAAALESAFAPVGAHIDALIKQEAVDGAALKAETLTAERRTVWGIVGAMAGSVTLIAALGWVWNRRLHSEVEPAEKQAEFTDALQLSGNESEAHHLLQRYLERTVVGATATVLNRNNSADRLEAVTTIPPDSPLVGTLPHAEPRSCLAVRSARIHDEDHQRPALLSCPVCGDLPGRSTCTPLTVGGEVIGSVLLNRLRPFGDLESQRIRYSVGQAAPVLANLRNLAIAEVRAATDSLTGLPNKRAVGDTLHRMLAQASRTMTPLSLVMLDLDHFKEVNDRYGHPVGDQALANVGTAIRSALRDSDFAGRTGGEEFVVMLPDTAVDGAVLAAEKLRKGIAGIRLSGVDVAMSASVGIAVYPEHATGAERLERLADSALYVAKHRGRDRIEVAAPSEEPLSRS